MEHVVAVGSACSSAVLGRDDDRALRDLHDLGVRALGDLRLVLSAISGLQVGAASPAGRRATVFGLRVERGSTAPVVVSLPVFVGLHVAARWTASYCESAPVPLPADGPPVTDWFVGSGLQPGPMTFGSQS